MSTFSHPRMKREEKTIEAMIRIYCTGHHRPQPTLCPQCRDLLLYAKLRLRHCPFQAKKTTCGNCPIHCYKPDMRKKVQEVMRYSGPKMLSKHPILAIRHMIDSLKKSKKAAHPKRHP